MDGPCWGEGIGVREEIKVIEAGRTVEIHIDRVHKKNALTAEMYRRMAAALEGASKSSRVDVMLIAAEGPVFCSGNDLKDFLAGPAASAAAFDFVKTLVDFQKPIIAAVQGAAVGIGTTMLFHCDLVYATPDAQLSMPFVGLGLVPEAGASLLAPAALGHAKAASMLLLGEPLDAASAERAGLVTAIIPDDLLLAHARAKAAALAAQPAKALAVTRRLMRPNPDGLAARIDEEAHHFKELMQSADAREAFTAFLEKRKPIFSR